MKTTGLIDTWTTAQNEGHCGATSLAYSLALLGIATNQSEVVKTSGLSHQFVTQNGMEPTDLRRAARHFGVSLKEEVVEDRRKGAQFLRLLKDHLKEGNPALFLKDDLWHWVAIYGWVPEANRFVVADPDEDEPFLGVWTEREILSAGWNVDEEDGSSQYCALLLKRIDRRPAVLRMSPEWIRLAQRYEDSDDSSEVLTMFHDLVEVADSATKTPERHNNAAQTSEEPLKSFLVARKREIVDAVTHWSADADVTPKELAAFYDDLVTLADAVGKIVPGRANVSVAVQITTLCSIYWWWGDEYFVDD